MDPVTLLRQEHVGNKVEVLVSLLYHFLLVPGGCAIDGGANGGLHTIPMGHLVSPSGKIVAYEPQPEVHRQLCRWADVERLQSVVDARRKALGRKAGQASFFVNPNNNALSSLDLSFAREGSKAISVDVVRLDDDLKNENVCFVKLDLEGGEFPAVCGARRIIERSRPVIIFECAREFSAERFGFSRDEFFSFFRAVNYELWDVFGRRMSEASWADPSTAWEWIASPVGDPRTRLMQHITGSYWAGIGSRPPLADWRETMQLVANPLQYYDPFAASTRSNSDSL